ncbi:MAG: cytochrome c oxidase subunit II [Candidatus Hydrogenedentes bacterium]|nr:cytochrome c oxidase subunit II [Candidatus Hydrogenedentota bacterium]
MFDFPLLPVQASTFAPSVDYAFWFLSIFVMAFTIGVTCVLIFLGLKYKQTEGRRSHHPEALKLEIIWTLIPTIIGVGFFAWGAQLYFEAARIPENTYDLEVIGKQWMWKIQHPNGRREVNELHIPVDQAVKLSMTSQDVIHSFFVPAFRKKQDVLPGKKTHMWFQATKPGVYPLFCAEYCGTEHSTMVGTVYVMERADYLEWLEGGPVLTPSVEGEEVFNRMGCITCHAAGDSQRGPHLGNVFGSEVKLQDGGTTVADEEYLRESILYPSAKVVAGYVPLMPDFKSQLTEEDVNNLVAYIKSLSDK